MNSEQLRLSEDLGDSEVRITAVGEIDLLTARELDALIARHLSARRDVILDLSGLKFIDSTGLAVVLKSTARAENERLTLTLAATSREVDRVLDIAGAERLVRRAGTD